nr:uncharacterized protein LOC112029752 [Quercus suber]
MSWTWSEYILQVPVGVWDVGDINGGAVRGKRIGEGAIDRVDEVLRVGVGGPGRPREGQDGRARDGTGEGGGDGAEVVGDGQGCRPGGQGQLQHQRRGRAGGVVADLGICLVQVGAIGGVDAAGRSGSGVVLEAVTGGAVGAGGQRGHGAEDTGIAIAKGGEVGGEVVVGPGGGDETGDLARIADGTGDVGLPIGVALGRVEAPGAGGGQIKGGDGWAGED